MTPADALRFSWHAAIGYPVRTALMMTAMAIGVAAVVVLTALGEGARLYVLGEFSSLGSNLLIVLPGRAETAGGTPGVLFGETTRDLTLADALALARTPGVRRMAPLVVGSAEISRAGRLREVTVAGTTTAFIEVRRLEPAQGRFLAEGDPTLASPVCVLGAKLREELFGAEPAVGQWLRLGDRRFRVVGVMQPSGQGLGMNADEIVYVPVASAQMLFDTESLFRILVETRDRSTLEQTRERVRGLLKVRHEGEEDVTVITQDAVLATFDRILTALTLAVAGIAAISLAVAGILVMNVMLVAVTQRTAEIGLLKALGATGRNIRAVFFAEAALLSLGGAMIGLGLGLAGAAVIRQIYPALPAYPPAWASIAGVSTALATGILFSLLPARRAAQLDPVLALMRR